MNNPGYEYVHITAEGAQNFNDVPDLDLRIIWHGRPAPRP
jgi:hypothetical protein